MREKNRRHLTGNRRRMRQRRCRRATFFAAAVSLTVGLLACGFTARAQGQAADSSRKYFTSILVMPGDTLESIAVRYADEHYDSLEDYIREVCSTNHLAQQDHVDAGVYLVVPYYAQDAKAPQARSYRPAG